MSGSGWNSRHYENHFLAEQIRGSFDRPRGGILPNVLPPNSTAYLYAPLPPPMYDNNYLSFLRVSQPINPISSATIQQRFIRPSQSAPPAPLTLQVPPIASALAASPLQIQAPIMHVERQRRVLNVVAPANTISSSSAAPEVIDLAQSDEEEETVSVSDKVNINEDSSGGDVDDTAQPCIDEVKLSLLAQLTCK
ncbi:hypothetical protein GH714_021396 [Hevea brasiliensis]|uniref:Uncharacterized protein n=1 Tax=Hevea brasiliensis TaxID=3981 RepID=A0A6A6MN78_HEVBR|nr:hypothetical protein GH714_021396 [Hevea brasiliensis]